MARVYINLHPNYHYSIAIIQKGFIPGLIDYCKTHEHVMYERNRQLFIHKQKNTLKEFIIYLFENNNTIFVRNEKSDEWIELNFKNIDSILSQSIKDASDLV